MRASNPARASDSPSGTKGSQGENQGQEFTLHVVGNGKPSKSVLEAKTYLPEELPTPRKESGELLWGRAFGKKLRLSEKMSLDFSILAEKKGI